MIFRLIFVLHSSLALEGSVYKEFDIRRTLDR